MNDPLIQVFYPVYEDIVRASVGEYLSGVERGVVSKLGSEKVISSKLRI